MIGDSDPWFVGGRPPWYRRPGPLAATVLVIVIVVLVVLGAGGSGRRSGSLPTVAGSGQAELVVPARSTSAMAWRPGAQMTSALDSPFGIWP